jgi:S-adenosyl-L-methionine hydrolase (adenosine-forming)
MPLPLPISFLSDYGHRDEFVGVCHGVIQRIAPGAVVIDLAHGLPRHAVRQAAIVLRNSLPYLPAGVHLAVVDPSVGTGRRALALRCGDRYLVGPDNGLLAPAADRLGGVEAAVDLSNGLWRLEPVSATFHGRDVFAPAAGHLALGEPLEDGGEPVEPETITPLEPTPPSRIGTGTLTANVIGVDGFGNVQLDASVSDLATAGLELGDEVIVQVRDASRRARVGHTFADADATAGGLVVYLDSVGAVALAVNAGDAAAELGLSPGDEVTITLAGEATAS